MTPTQELEIMAAELAKSEQMPIEHCRRWIARCLAARDKALFAEDGVEVVKEGKQHERTR